MSIYHIFLVIQFLFQQCQCDVYTATVSLEDLLDTEYVVIKTLENYIKAEEKKLDNVKSQLNIYQKHQEKAQISPQLYIGNPLNAFKLIKRLTSDWYQVQTLISTNVNKETLANITKLYENNIFPSHEDFNGAAEALIRLQRTYRLDTASLARGELNGVKYSSKLNAADCFELGKHLYNKKDFYQAGLWMEEALTQLEKETKKTTSKPKILGYLAYSNYQQGNISLALKLNKKIIELTPDDEQAIININFLEEQLKKKINKRKYEPESEFIYDESKRIKTEEIKSNYDDYGKNMYEALCRGDVSTPVEVQAKLKCRYVSDSHPFLKIAPFKLEESNLEPEILLFHDVISDDEIATIKRLSLLRFKRATVRIPGGKQEEAAYRICKVAWLDNKDHKHIADVSQRVEDMTGLTMTSAELFQVVNYGIGGHYEPHCDFSETDESYLFGKKRNRIATMLFYLSDVDQGGATVFPKAKTAIFPKKGNAAFWYNLLASGEVDRRTIHGACPVLVGSKWISTKWIHEEGQEFRKPCIEERSSKTKSDFLELLKTTKAN